MNGCGSGSGVCFLFLFSLLLLECSGTAAYQVGKDGVEPSSVVGPFLLLGYLGLDTHQVGKDEAKSITGSGGSSSPKISVLQLF